MPSFRTCAFIDPIKPKYAIILSPRQILPSIGGLLITCERVGQVCFVRTLLTNYRTCQAFNLALELLKPRPPFRADEKYPRGSFPRGGFPGAALGARDRSLGRSISGWLSVSCPRGAHGSLRCLAPRLCVRRARQDLQKSLNLSGASSV